MSVVANVAINVDSRGAPAKLKQVADRSKQVEKAVQNMNGDLRRSQREFNGAGNAASQAAGGFSKLGKAIGGIITVAAAFQALKFTIISTAELETQTRSLKVLTGSLETAQKIVQQLQDIGAVTPFTSTELIETAKRLSAFGVETSKLVDTTRRLGDVAGATGADLGGIATAFGQIQAKGRLQGEELLQLQERGIDLQSELQRMYGLTGEEFRKALEKGRFSAEAVDVALQNLTNTGGKYANGAIAQSDTLAGKFSTLQDGITRTAQAIGQILSPALQTILEQAIGVINSINNALAAGRRIQQFGIDAQQRNQLFQQAGKEAEEIARLRGGGRIDPAVFTRLRDERFKDLIERYGYETGQIQIETQAPTIGTPKIPELLGGNGNGKKSANAADEAKRIQERISGLQQDVALNEKLRGIREKIAEADLAGDQALAVKLQGEERLVQLVDSYDRLKASAANNAERDALEAKLQSEALLEQQNVLAQLNKLDNDKAKAFEDQLRPLEEQRRLFEAQLNGRREEEELIIQIENATRGLGDAEAQRVKQLIRGNAELKKQAKQPNLIRDLSAQVKQLQDELNPVKLATETIINGAFAIGDAFSQAFRDVITGAKSTQEALADTFETIGKAFIDMATQIIAQQIVMITMQAILKALGGPSFGGGGGAPNVDAISQYSGIGANTRIPTPTFRANGGSVSPNSTYIVGERGPELLTMGSQGGYVHSNTSAAMDRYRNGEGPAGTRTVNVSYSVTEINGMKFVTEDQFRAGMDQAAQRGAKMGQSRTISTLKNSRAQRSKLGL